MPVSCPLRKAGRIRGNARRGAVIVLVAIVMMVLLVISAFAINICYMSLCQTELRIACDAAARAGARELARSGDDSSARTAAINIAAANRVAGSPVALAAEDVEFGRSARSSATDRFDYQPGATPLNAVRVNARRTAGSPSGSVSLYLGGLLGTTSFEPQAWSTAAATSLDICLVIDMSGSMAFEPDESVSYQPRAADLDQNGVWSPGEWRVGDPPPIPGNARWNGLKTASTVFFNKLRATPGVERVATVLFSSNAGMLSDFTSSYSGTESGLQAISPNGATGIGEGIAAGHNLFRFSASHRPGAVKIMIVMTDGEQNTGQPWQSASQAAAADGITIHGIAFANGASTATIDGIAGYGGGISCQASSNAQLVAAFNRIADMLPVLLVE